MAITKASAQTTVNSGVTAAAAATINQILVAPASATTVAGGGSLGGVTISNVSIMSNAFANASVLSGDTAVSTAGGFVKITGTGFKTAANVFLGSTVLANTFVSATQINANIPASSAATYQFTVFNTDGSGAIYSPGLTISGPPSWTTTSYSANALNLGNIQLLASGDAPLTYYIQPGSANPQNLAVNSAGYLSGTVAAEGAYTITVIVDDAQGQSTQADITVTISVTDVYFNRTTVALPADTTTWVTDASTNAYVLTVNGDTRPSAFSPYKTVWSNSFDGTGDYLTIADNTAFDFANGDFTVECWFYRTGGGGRTAQVILNQSTGGAASNSAFYLGAGNDGLSLYLSTTGSSWTNFIESAIGPTFNAWSHIVWQRRSNTLELYFNGTLQTVVSGTAAFSGTIFNSSRLVEIGRQDTSGSLVVGYISNLRVVKGSAVYTTNFTPSTTPLTAIANTSLLTCQSNRFVDNSTNAFAITQNGDVSVSNFAPFVETDTTTASGYFDGSGDYLTVGTSTNLALGAGDFTVETWLYLTAYNASTSAIFDYRTAGSTPTNIPVFVLSASGVPTFYQSVSLGPTLTASSAVPLNTWSHLALVRNGSSITIYLNGTSIGSATGTNPLGIETLRINDPQGSYGQAGYFSNFRIVKGTAVYTSSFTPPTAPLTAIANTSLLTLQYPQGENNHRFVDQSNLNHLITRNGNATQGTFSPFSQTGWSGYFTGASTSYITTPATSLLDQGQTYTVQCWIYPTTFTTSTSAVRRMYIFIKGVIYAGLSIHSDGTLGWYGWPTPAGMIVTSAAGTITTHEWQHVALVVNPSGNTIKLFKNGVEVGSAAYTAAGAGNAAIQIGHGDTSQGTDGFIGYISNFKVTLSALTGGQLDYSATPTISSPTGSALLVLQTNRFNDTSANAFSITNGGVTSIQAFSPFAPAAQYSTSTNGGSAYFDGTGDFLSFANNAVLNPGTDDFVMEAWVYITALTGNNQGFNGKGTAGVEGYSFYMTNARVLSFVWNGTGGATITGGTLNLNQWHHVAVVRNNNVIRLYLDGTGAGSSTACTTDITSTATKYVGQARGGNPVLGYMSNYRMMKGSRPATYDATSSSLTVPTAPLTSVPNTALLLNFTNAGIIDATGKNVVEAVGDARVSSVQSKFGGSSMYFDGTGDYLKIQPSDLLATWFNSDYTIEYWVYPNAFASSANGGSNVYSQSDPASTSEYFSFGPRASGVVVWYYYNGAVQVVTSGTISTGVWTHLAWTYQKSSNTMRIFINGVLNTTTTIAGTPSITTTANPILVGASTTVGFNGYIDDLRITRGFARYTATFTPPTATFKLR